MPGVGGVGTPISSGPSTFAIGAGQAAINTASGFLGSVMGRIFGKKDRENQLEQQAALNEQAYDINNRMAEANYERDMRMWEDTGYVAQKDQMKRAGLNPALMYGMSGGGGQTANAAGAGSGVGAGQAPSARMGVNINPVAIMEIQNMRAQQDLIRAQTAKVKAETTNLPLTGENIIASTGNIQADTELKKINTKIAELEEEYKGATLEQRIGNFAEEATILHQQARSAMAKGNIDTVTQEAVIEQINANVAATYIKMALDNSGIAVNEQQIKESAARILQGWANLSIQEKNMKINKFNAEMKASYPSMSEATGTLINRAVSSIWGLGGEKQKQSEARDFKIDFNEK